MTLVEFLLARIAEDEAAAETSFDPQWTAHPEMAGQPIIDATGHRLATAAETVMAHIARHDPARVVAECEAKRRIVELHKDWPVLVEGRPELESMLDPRDVGSMTMRMSKQIMWTTEQKYREHFGTEPPTGRILRALAAVYADHPDYDETWRP